MAFAEYAFEWYLISKLTYFQITFGRLDDSSTNYCAIKTYIYEDIVYDEVMQCQMDHEEKCFDTQETTFESFSVKFSSLLWLILPHYRVTRWLDYSSIFGHLQQWKFAQEHKKLPKLVQMFA